MGLQFIETSPTNQIVSGTITIYFGNKQTELFYGVDTINVWSNMIFIHLKDVDSNPYTLEISHLQQDQYQVKFNQINSGSDDSTVTFKGDTLIQYIQLLSRDDLESIRPSQEG